MWSWTDVEVKWLHLVLWHTTRPASTTHLNSILWHQHLLTPLDIMTITTSHPSLTQYTGNATSVASYLIYSQALLEYTISFCCWSNGYILLAQCYLPCFFILREKWQNSATLSLMLTSRADLSDKLEWYCRTVHCCQINLVQ